MKVVQGLFLLILAVVLSVAAFLTSSAFKWAEELPLLDELDALEFTATSQIFARDGETLIGEILPVVGEDRASTNRIPVSLDEVSPAALAAIVASEDDQFFEHYGFDIPGLAKATYLEFLGDGGRGGSTISTQVIKNTVLSDIADERSIERKVKELMLAVKLERRLTKPEILQRYINVVYWGGNIYGIRAAARAYFGKEPVELNLAEGLYLARLIPTPSRNYEDFVATRRSMRVVLDNMVAQGTISPEMAERAWRYPIEPTGWQVEYDPDGNIVGEPVRTTESLALAASVSSNDLAPHVTWTVRNQLLEQFGYGRVFGAGGLRIYTTIDVQQQRAANQASLRADIPPGAQTAIVGVDPETGEVLAMTGERIRANQEIGEFNRVTSAFRQPGSSFKPIIYATAIEQGGYTQADVIADEELVIPQPGGRPNYEPVNHDDRFIGRRTLREHLNISRNIPVVKLVEAVTPEAVVARANQLGYTTLQPFLSLALGSFEVTPLQHASAMGAFANGGVYVEPVLITRVEDGDGNVIWEAVPRERRVWSEQTAYVMLDMLHANVNDSGAFSGRARIDGRWVAGKTGTTNDERDIWFVGMTPGLVAAVWIGYDDNSSIPLSMPNGERVTSSRQPIYVWRDFVDNALQGTPAGREYPVPEGVVFQTMDRVSGAIGSGVQAAFLSGSTPSQESVPRASQNVTITIPIDTRTNTRATADTPRSALEWRTIDPTEISRYTN